MWSSRIKATFRVREISLRQTPFASLSSARCELDVNIRTSSVPLFGALGAPKASPQGTQKLPSGEPFGQLKKTLGPLELTFGPTKKIPGDPSVHTLGPLSEPWGALGFPRVISGFPRAH